MTTYTSPLTRRLIISSLFFALSLAAAGCAKRQAQGAAQTALTAVARGVASADEAVAEAIGPAADEAREQLAEERAGDMDATHDTTYWLDRYDALMQPWSRAVTALLASRATLHLGQGALTLWIETGHMGEDWGPFCDGVGEVFGGLGLALEAARVSVPSIVGLIEQNASRACQLVAPWVESAVGGE